MMYEPVITAYAQVLLIIVFGAAGWAKLRSPEAFEGVVYNFRILPERLAGPFARLLPAVELGVAAGLVLPVARSVAAMAALVLLIAFCVAIAVNLARGRREIDCGCFSSTLKQHLSGALILRNVALMALAVLLIRPAAAGTGEPALWLVGAAAALVTVFVYTTATLLQRFRQEGVVGGRRQTAGGA